MFFCCIHVIKRTLLIFKCSFDEISSEISLCFCEKGGGTDFEGTATGSDKLRGREDEMAVMIRKRKAETQKGSFRFGEIVVK